MLRLHTASLYFALIALPASAATLRHDVGRDGADHELRLSCAGGKHELREGAALRTAADIGAVDTLVIQGAPGQADRLTVDFTSRLCVAPGGIDFDGGEGGNDSLELHGGHVSTITFTQGDKGSGVIRYEDGVHAPALVRFRGMEQVTSTLGADDIEFELTNANDNASLNPQGAGMSRLSAATIGIVDFANPSGSVTISCGDGDDIVTVQDLETGYPTLVIDGQVGNDQIDLIEPLGFAADKSLGLSFETIHASDDITVSGTGAIELTAARSVTVSQADLSAANGDITLKANLDGTNPGLGGGVLVGLSTITTSGTGDIHLEGRAAVVGAFPFRVGVHLDGQSVISSTSAAVGAGTITLIGTGGSGTSGNMGIRLTEASKITSVTGAIELMGQGGTGTGQGQLGMSIDGGSQILSTGSGTAAATISIQGTGGIGTFRTSGVVLEGINTKVSSVDGAIEITGVAASGAGGINVGVWMLSSSQIVSSGTTTDAATISIDGTGGDEGDFTLDGVNISSSSITSVAGNIKITGVGGSSPAGSGNGIKMDSGSKVTSTAIAAPAASITIVGTGGTTDAQSSNTGVVVQSSGTEIASVVGPIQITGQGGANGGAGVGIKVVAASQIRSTGTGLSAAPITLVGTGSTGESSDGVSLDEADTKISSVDGTVQITGTAVGLNTQMHGVILGHSTRIEITGAADLTISGATPVDPLAVGAAVFLVENNISSPGTGDVRLNGTGQFDSQIQWGTLTLGKPSGVVDFNGRVEGGALTVGTGAYSVSLRRGGAITGAVTFNNTGGVVLGEPGSSLAFGSVTSTASATTLAGALSTLTSMTIGSLELIGDASLSSAGGTMTIASLDGGGKDLTIRAATIHGTLTVAGAVTDLGDGTGAALTIEDGAIGLVHFQNAFTSNSGISAPGQTSNVRFDGDVTANSGNAGVSLAGSVQLDGLTFLGTHDLSFGAAILSGGAVTITATDDSDVGFVSTVNGAQSLTVNTDGVTSFGGTIGGSTPIGTLTTDAGGSTSIAVTALRSNAAQNYGDALTLAGRLDSDSHDITFAEVVHLSGSAAVDVDAATITFGGDLELGQHDLSLEALAATDLGLNTTMLDPAELTAANGVHVPAAATLSGGGSILGTLTVESGGKLVPGGALGVGVLSIGSLDLQNGSTLSVNLYGAGVGEYDQIKVDNSLTLAGTLDATLGYPTDEGDRVILFDNSNVARVGTFPGLPEGTEVFPGTMMSITYVGGDGDDIALSVPVPTPAPGWPGLAASVMFLAVAGWRGRTRALCYNSRRLMDAKFRR